MGGFFKDLVTGNFGDIWQGIEHHPLQALEDVGLAGAAVAAPFLLPEIGGALGIGGAAAEGAGALGGAEAGSALAFAPEAATGAETGAFSSILPESAFGGAAIGNTGGAISDAAAFGGANVTGLTGGATGGAAATGGSLWDSLLGGATKSLTSNPLGIAAAGLGLGYDVLQGQKTPQSTQDVKNQLQPLNAEIGGLNAEAKTLSGYLDSGTLPAGLQAQLDQAKSAAKARIISNYASQGMNTDPKHNSALAQELNNVDLQGVGEQGKVASQLLQQAQGFISAGTQLTGLENQIYTELANLDMTQTQNVGKAIAAFAGALGGGGGTKIQLGGTSSA